MYRDELKTHLDDFQPLTQLCHVRPLRATSAEVRLFRLFITKGKAERRGVYIGLRGLVFIIRNQSARLQARNGTTRRLAIGSPRRAKTIMRNQRAKLHARNGDEY